MFSLFRRKPSPYAVAIRDSLRDAPHLWFCSGSNVFWSLAMPGEYIRIDGRYRFRWWTPRADRRVIREGIEAWIAWSLTRKETT